MPAALHEITKRIMANVVLIGLASAVLTLAACGSSSQRHPPRKQIRFWHMWTAEWKVVIDRYVKNFNNSQDEYEVVALSIPASGGANTKFLLGVAGGDPPDVMAQWNQIIPAWGSKGLLVPLDSLMTAEEWKQYQKTTYPIAQKIGTFRGHLYGVTTGVNAWACYYHPRQLREAGLDPDHFPNTLEQLTQWAERLNRFDKQGHLTHMGFLPTTLQMFVNLYGGGFWDAQEQQLLFATPKNVDALDYLTQYHRKYGFDEVLRFTSGLSTTGSSSGTDWPFISGAFSIALDGQWRVKQLADVAPDVEYRVAPLPAPAAGREKGGYGSGNFMIIPKGAKQVQGAWKFIRYVSGLQDPEVAGEICSWGGWLPLNDYVANSKKFQEYLAKNPAFRTFVDIVHSPNIEPIPPVPFQDYLYTRIAACEDAAVVRGMLSPKQALERLEDEMNREIKRRKALGYEE